ncbi:MAG: class 1 isoprenoid biosynthesis enzyme, partial [Bacteroidota bacterium]|nr:class 1 isoprenoid biosynthesis enzyme [Bacteroidota bacterium]
MNYTLSASEKKKVLFYYPMYTVLACAQMYLTLKGRKITKDERKRLTIVGAMATLCDDLIDENNFTRKQVFNLLSNNFDEETQETKAKLLVALNKELQKLYTLSPQYLQQLKMALQRQAVSITQSNPNISLEEIVNICREKNGHTSLMFASLLDEKWSNQELKFIYQSAIVGQLTNDSFDIYFDTQEGINTYFNRAPSIKNVRDFFLDECTKLHAIVMACDVPKKNKLKTIQRMS